MREKLYIYMQRVGLEVLGLLFLIIIFIESFRLELGYNLSFGFVSLIVLLTIAFSSYKTIHRKRTRFIVSFLFFLSAFLITISNLFFFEILSKYHPLFYSILLGQIVLFPFILKNDSYNVRNKDGVVRDNVNDKKKWKNYAIYTITLFFIVIFSFFLRIYNVGKISPGRDSLHHYIAAKAINDHGSAVYETLPYINEMLAFIFRNFGETIVLAKLPFIIAGTLSVLLIYFIGRKISPIVGIISAVLFAICPWAIGLSGYVRDYSLNILYQLFFIVLILYYPKDIKKFKGLIYFVILNVVIYSSLIIFARFQGGLTISIIIALLITTFVRVFYELGLYEKAKSFNFRSKEVNYLMHAGILTLFVAILVIYIFGFDRRLVLTFQPMWFFMFLSESRLPTLWYSFMQVPWYFIFSLTLIPLLARPKDKYVWVSFLIFYAYLIFFVFLARPHTMSLHARYIYPGFPFFIILISTSLYYIISMSLNFTRNKIFKVLSFVFVLIFLATIFNFNNTLYAISGENSWETDERQVISDPYFDYTELINFLTENGFSKENVVILSELRAKDTIAWHFDFDFYEGRNITSFNMYLYDIADNMYIIDENSVNVIKENQEGWIIRRDGDIFPQTISLRARENVLAIPELQELGVVLVYVGKYSDKYEVYVWYRDEY